jgi:hypothetical protein
LTALVFDGWRWACPVCGAQVETISLADLVQAADYHTEQHGGAMAQEAEMFLKGKAEG